MVEERLQQSELEEFDLQTNRKLHPAEHKGTNLQIKSLFSHTRLTGLIGSQKTAFRKEFMR